jgi:hypothetical protein
MLRWVAIAMLIVILMSAGGFLFEEWQRSTLIAKYSRVGESVKLPNQVGAWSTGLLLGGEEEVACAMDSYGWLENLKALNDRQKKTLSKTDLPSESGAWYLLFFSADQIKRIAMIDYSKYRLDQVSTSCGSKLSTFSISTISSFNEQQYRSFTFDQVVSP